MRASSSDTGGSSWRGGAQRSTWVGFGFGFGLGLGFGLGSGLGFGFGFGLGLGVARRLDGRLAQLRAV